MSKWDYMMVNFTQYFFNFFSKSVSDSFSGHCPKAGQQGVEDCLRSSPRAEIESGESLENADNSVNKIAPDNQANNLVELDKPAEEHDRHAAEAEKQDAGFFGGHSDANARFATEDSGSLGGVCARRSSDNSTDDDGSSVEETALRDNVVAPEATQSMPSLTNSEIAFCPEGARRELRSSGSDSITEAALETVSAAGTSQTTKERDEQQRRAEGLLAYRPAYLDSPSSEEIVVEGDDGGVYCGSVFATTASQSILPQGGSEDINTYTKKTIAIPVRDFLAEDQRCLTSTAALGDATSDSKNQEHINILNTDNTQDTDSNCASGDESSGPLCTKQDIQETHPAEGLWHWATVHFASVKGFACNMPQRAGNVLLWTWNNSIGVLVGPERKAAPETLSSIDRVVNTPVAVDQSSDAVDEIEVISPPRLNARRVVGALGIGIVVVGAVVSGAPGYALDALGGLFSEAVSAATSGALIAGAAAATVYGGSAIKSWALPASSQSLHFDASGIMPICSGNPVKSNENQTTDNDSKGVSGNVQSEGDAVKDLNDSDQGDEENKSAEPDPNSKSIARELDQREGIKQTCPSGTLRDLFSFFNPRLNKGVNKIKQNEWRGLLECLDPFLPEGFLGLRRIFRKVIFYCYEIRECFARIGLLEHRSFSEWLAGELFADFDYQDSNKFRNVFYITQGFFVSRTPNFALPRADSDGAEKEGNDSPNTLKDNPAGFAPGHKIDAACSESSFHVPNNPKESDGFVRTPGDFLSDISVSALDNASEKGLLLAGA